MNEVKRNYLFPNFELNKILKIIIWVVHEAKLFFGKVSIYALS